MCQADAWNYYLLQAYAIRIAPFGGELLEKNLCIDSRRLNYWLLEHRIQDLQPRKMIYYVYFEIIKVGKGKSKIEVWEMRSRASSIKFARTLVMSFPLNAVKVTFETKSYNMAIMMSM